MSAHDDARLAARAAVGDDLAFEALVARHRPALVRTAAARLGPYAAEAEDVVQDALARAHAVLRRGDRPENIAAWLHAIVRNRAIDVVRGHPGRHNAPLGDHDQPAADTPDAVLARRESVAAALSAIEALPGRQRDALVGAVFSGASYEDLAGAQDTTVSAVKAMLARARRSVRAAAAAVFPFPGLAREVANVLKGCACAGAVGAASLAIAPIVPLAVHPATSGPRHRPALLTATQLDRLAVQWPSPPRPHGLRPLEHATPLQYATPPATAEQAIAACLAGRPLPHASSVQLRLALRELPADAAQYGGCEPALRAALLEAT